jgi:tetratricopeptide (TPR) repeat protein
MVQNAERIPMTGRSRKHRTEAAIAAALAGDWKAAATENRSLLDESPRDVEAANRLGKALTELGQKKQAIEAYRAALAIDAANPIARKNLARLEDTKAPARPARARHADPTEPARPATSLIEASDRAAEFTLQQTNDAALAKLEPGDPAQLEANPRGIAVKSLGGELLGYIEPRSGLRLRRMIEGGNTYAVVVRTITDQGAVVHIRETYKHPSLVGQASFLQSPTARRRVVRPYTKSSVVRYDRDTEFDLEDDAEGPAADTWRPRAAVPADEDDTPGFSEEPMEIDDDEIELTEEDEAEEAEEDEEE